MSLSKWLAFIELLNHPWFGSIWVIQEVTLASKLTVSYGNIRIPKDTLVIVMNAIGFLVFLVFFEMGLLAASTGDSAVKRKHPTGYQHAISNESFPKDDKPENFVELEDSDYRIHQVQNNGSSG
ncbi:hypothetical protein AOQ84DRAFT_283597 [Glonium stellatum]|uniref:Uncharacterized protein n=1 Tax=Glonium stellatum TaxID=574774 RepID=A0A8E2FA34_9PEZI|nr:hypothetical protein AOQ84DRAFT_283597 [Glonium stellatum]